MSENNADDSLYSMPMVKQWMTMPFVDPTEDCDPALDLSEVENCACGVSACGGCKPPLEIEHEKSPAFVEFEKAMIQYEDEFTKFEKDDIKNEKDNIKNKNENNTEERIVDFGKRVTFVVKRTPTKQCAYCDAPHQNDGPYCATLFSAPPCSENSPRSNSENTIDRASVAIDSNQNSAPVFNVPNANCMQMSSVSNATCAPIGTPMTSGIHVSCGAK